MQQYTNNSQLQQHTREMKKNETVKEYLEFHIAIQTY